MSTGNFMTHNRRSFCVLFFCLLLQCSSAFVLSEPKPKVSFRSRFQDTLNKTKPRDVLRKKSSQSLPFMASSLVVPITKSGLLAPCQTILQWVSNSLSVTVPPATTLFALAWSTQHWQLNLLKHVFTMINAVYVISAFKELRGKTKSDSKALPNYLLLGAWAVGGAAWLARTFTIPVYVVNLAKHSFSLWAMIALFSVVRDRVSSGTAVTAEKAEATEEAVVEPKVEATISTPTSQKKAESVDIPKEETTNDDLFFEPIEENEIVQTAVEEEPIKEDGVIVVTEEAPTVIGVAPSVDTPMAEHELDAVKERLYKAVKYLANLQEELAVVQLEVIPAEFKEVYDRTQQKLTKYQMNKDNFTFGRKNNEKKQR